MFVMANLTSLTRGSRCKSKTSAQCWRGPKCGACRRATSKAWGPARNPYTTRIDAKSLRTGLMARYRLLEQMVKAFQAAGVRLLVGTDAMNTGVVPGFSLHGRARGPRRGGAHAP